jgi:branched-chain amino acid transport system substrate-binding protein
MRRNDLWKKCLTLLALGTTALSLPSCVQDTQTVWRVPSLDRSLETPSSSPAAQPSLPSGPVASSAAPADGAPSAPPRGLAKVALLLPLSGKGSDVGASMLNAAQLAMFDLGANAFELMPRDTGTAPDGARGAAEAAMQEGASLVLGPLFAGDVKTVAPITLQRGVNVVSFTTDMGSVGANVFTLGFLPQTQVRQIVGFAAGQNLRRIALIAPQDTYGSAVADTFDLTVRQMGLVNSGIIRYAAGGTARRPACLSHRATVPR